MASNTSLWHPSMVPADELREMHTALEKAVSQLKETKDPKIPRKLLQELRRLLAKADRHTLDREE
jgi:hypothetical protein